ncbi:hypothetical protein WJX74_003161 [Apatococcus lobatus]|uniref:Uncharacterized protein n=1 Tax=Apatococcus lobatus TaxID=904363 RepID=A0AAW1QIY4_9CHLO
MLQRAPVRVPEPVAWQVPHHRHVDVGQVHQPGQLGVLGAAGNCMRNSLQDIPIWPVPPGRMSPQRFDKLHAQLHPQDMEPCHADPRQQQLKPALSEANRYDRPSWAACEYGISDRVLSEAPGPPLQKCTQLLDGACEPPSAGQPVPWSYVNPYEALKPVPSPENAWDADEQPELVARRGQKRRTAAVRTTTSHVAYGWCPKKPRMSSRSMPAGCKKAGSNSRERVLPSKATQQLKALEQINLVGRKSTVPPERQLSSEGSTSRASPENCEPSSGSPVSPEARAHQLAQDKQVERLINEVHMLGLKKASLEERKAATRRTIAAIQDACSLSLRPCIQMQFFTPHAEACQVAAAFSCDAKAVVEGVLQCKYNKRLRVTHGLLAGISKPAQLLRASEEAYQDTESAYLHVLGTGIAKAAELNGQNEVLQATVEISLLFTLRSQARRSSMVRCQHDGLMTLSERSQQQTVMTDERLAQMELTEGQTTELVKVRENYLERTRKLLQQRQSLWTTARANLLDTSLEDGCPSAESKVCAFEKVLELQHNMDEYHWNFTWMMREWMLHILSPSQGLASRGLQLLESLALKANGKPASLILCKLDIPVPRTPVPDPDKNAA